MLAALLHDVGHGPFSHSLEDIIGPAFAHERMSVRILTAPESEIHRLLVAHDPGLPQRLRAFIQHGPPGTQSWIHAIVSSQLDADRLDYLARDALMAGIRTHTFDLGRLVRSLVVIDDHLVVDARAQDIVEAFLLALDQMYGTPTTQDGASGFADAGGDHPACAGSGARRRAGTLRERLFPRRAVETGSVPCRVDPGRRRVARRFRRVWTRRNVTSLLGQWRRFPRPTLSELATAHRVRRFPKMVRLPIETTSLSKNDWDTAVAQAIAIFQRAFPNRDPRYHVHFDEPKRLSYKRYTPTAARIRFASTTSPETYRPIESDPRSIANNLSTRPTSPVVVPGDIREKVERKWALLGDGVRAVLPTVLSPRIVMVPSPARSTS